MLPSSTDAIWAPLVRKERVRLVQAMTRMGIADPAASIWLSVATADPLPQVRYAAPEAADELNAASAPPIRAAAK